MNKLLDKTFSSENDNFLMGLLNAVNEGTATDYTKAHGFDFKDINWCIVKEVSKPGPYFDLRMAGGDTDSEIMTSDSMNCSWTHLKRLF